MYKILETVEEELKLNLASCAVKYTESELLGNKEDYDYYYQLFLNYSSMVTLISKVRELSKPYEDLASHVLNLALTRTLTYEVEDEGSLLYSLIENLNNKIIKHNKEKDNAKEGS